MGYIRSIAAQAAGFLYWHAWGVAIFFMVVSGILWALASWHSAPWWAFWLFLIGFPCGILGMAAAVAQFGWVRLQ